ncbi:DNA-3-methyladenine glycosylase 2 [Robertmurraya sp. DFI.2.37]|uniref:DNA-3-methyladenine glycosylase family protein n=1 Tax=Robertmurraya sp. DFI.2.37 TaxID=3031819 RepID=UPI001246F11F|nr:DNA-3-methyladenine glycosylase 2 [Robertmurraya sp. DFI.2.37]MDF1507337.1 DNA-3-methyladenine glycosylase 2 [Robertmurraya sp. DFI.2.37]
MNWIVKGSFIEIYPPSNFNFQECLLFLGRSDKEVTHQIKDDHLYKLIKVDEEVILLNISYFPHVIKVEFPMGTPSNSKLKGAVSYIWEWFDLDKPLEEFYKMARTDKILLPLIDRYNGLRIIGIPELFEALTWAIIGQQINLTFAYTLKKRFVEHFGESYEINGYTYWLFPDVSAVALLQVEDLRALQFTARKAEYVIGIAKLIAAGQLSKESLLQTEDSQEIYERLLDIRGVGAWTADYVMMKCFHHSSAFPLADVGLHQALKKQLALERKPTIEEIEEMAMNWKGWQAYATFYLWRSLYE